MFSKNKSLLAQGTPRKSLNAEVTKSMNVYEVCVGNKKLISKTVVDQYKQKPLPPVPPVDDEYIYMPQPLPEDSVYANTLAISEAMYNVEQLKVDEKYFFAFSHNFSTPNINTEPMYVNLEEFRRLGFNIKKLQVSRKYFKEVYRLIMKFIHRKTVIKKKKLKKQSVNLKSEEPKNTKAVNIAASTKDIALKKVKSETSIKNTESKSVKPSETDSKCNKSIPIPPTLPSISLPNSPTLHKNQDFQDLNTARFNLLESIKTGIKLKPVTTLKSPVEPTPTRRPSNECELLRKALDQRRFNVTVSDDEDPDYCLYMDNKWK